MAKNLAEVTPRQAEALEFIKESLNRRGMPPTLREMGKALGISSTNGVRYFLEVLEKRGHIVRSRRVSRGIQLTSPRSLPSRSLRSKVIPIPLLGRVAAGDPLLAEQNIEEILQLDRSQFPSSERTFALHVHGDSMSGAGILDGDVVIVETHPRPGNGEIVVAYWEGEATVKRFFRSGKRILLRPENDSYQDIAITASQEDFRILGRVVGLMRRY